MDVAFFNTTSTRIESFIERAAMCYARCHWWAKDVSWMLYKYIGYIRPRHYSTYQLSPTLSRGTMFRSAIRPFSTAAKGSLKIGLIPADGIGREVIPVRLSDTGPSDDASTTARLPELP